MYEKRSFFEEKHISSNQILNSISACNSAVDGEQANAKWTFLYRNSVLLTKVFDQFLPIYEMNI